MDPEAKKILDALKCPICQSNIDLIQCNNTRIGKGYNFGCVVNSFHYAIDFSHWESPPRIFRESVCLIDGSFQYELICSTNQGSIVYRQDIDGEGRVIDSILNKMAYLNPLYTNKLQV